MSNTLVETNGSTTYETVMWSEFPNYATISKVGLNPEMLTEKGFLRECTTGHEGYKITKNVQFDREFVGRRLMDVFISKLSQSRDEWLDLCSDCYDKFQLIDSERREQQLLSAQQAMADAMGISVEQVRKLLTVSTK